MIGNPVVTGIYFLKTKVLEALENPVKRVFSRAFLCFGAESVKYYKLSLFTGKFGGL